MVSKILLEMFDGRSSLAILSIMELLLLLLRLLMLKAMILLVLRSRRDDDGLQSETKKRGINAIVKIL